MHLCILFSKWIFIHLSMNFPQNKISCTYAFSLIHCLKSFIYSYTYPFIKNRISYIIIQENKKKLIVQDNGKFFILCIIIQENRIAICIFRKKKSHAFVYAFSKKNWKFVHIFLKHLYIHWKSFKVKKKISFENNWKKPLWNIDTYNKNHLELFEKLFDHSKLLKKISQKQIIWKKKVLENILIKMFEKSLVTTFSFKEKMNSHPIIGLWPFNTVKVSIVLSFLLVCDPLVQSLNLLLWAVTLWYKVSEKWPFDTRSSEKWPSNTRSSEICPSDTRSNENITLWYKVQRRYNPLIQGSVKIWPSDTRSNEDMWWKKVPTALIKE